MQNKYNLCKTKSKKNDYYLYFIECVKNDIYVYNRTDQERTIDEVFNIFKKNESFGDLGFEQYCCNFCTREKIDSNYEILFSFNSLEEIEKYLIKDKQMIIRFATNGNKISEDEIKKFYKA